LIALLLGVSFVGFALLLFCAHPACGSFDRVCNAPEQSLAPTYLPISPRAAGGEQDLCRTLVETEEALSIIPKT